MIYIISIVIYAIIFGASMHIIINQPSHVEKLVAKLCLLGFLLQAMVNYVFWGELNTFSPFISDLGIERNAINLMMACLISLFCYASLLVLLFKANDFYNNDLYTGQ